MKKINFSLILRDFLAFIALFTLSIGCSYQGNADSLDYDNSVQNDLETESTLSSEVTIADATLMVPETQTCQELYIERELREPYQRYDGNKPRYTLSKEELVAYFDLMGIEQICLPPQFGAPFINVDWNAEVIPAIGRMVSIGFEELYGGGGWSHGYLVYATYDFSVGSEYEVFASPIDFERVENGSISNLFDADGVQGFVRYHRGIPMGKQMVLKTYIFPFENAYIAVVINIGAYDPAEVDNIILEMDAGRHPDILNENVALMDSLVSSIRFR